MTQTALNSSDQNWNLNKKALKNPDLQDFSAFLIAGDERIELPPKVLETPIIPFDQSPVFI